MSAESFKRKLTAILSADVKGYSRLMGENEAETVKTLTVYRKIMAELIQQHRGRVIDSPGDNMLAEFGSVVDAVQCAVSAQNELKARNTELPENRRMLFRIGINLGDVIEEEGRIYGDGVNIAARLEALADAGGICISKTAFDHIETKLPLGYEYLGEKEVKNIAKPVGAYKVLMEPRVVGAGAKGKKSLIPVWRRKEVIAGAVAVLIVLIVAAIWNLRIRTLPLEHASKEKMSFTLPDEPSIAVLPFINMSEDPKQEFLSDAIAEEITTALSKIPRLFVISRESSFSYKGKAVKVKQVSEELGVKYVLEGSVQRSADRIRINAQLIDALTGRHIWAERYDRELKDLFALQDEITMKILKAIQVKLTEGEQVLGAKKSEEEPRLECYLKMMEAWKYYEGFNREATRKARGIAEEMLVTCPEYPRTYVLMGYIHLMESMLRMGKSPQESTEKAIEMAQKALAMDDSIAIAHALLCSLYPRIREYDKAVAEGERAVSLQPGGALVHMWYAASLCNADRAEEAIPVFKKAFRLNPFAHTGYYLSYGTALRMTGQFEEAVSTYKKALQLEPNNVLARIALVATYSLMGQEKEARAEAEEVLRLNPKLSVEGVRRNLYYKNQDQIDRFADALRKAGLK